MSILFLPPQSAGSVTIADATETTSGKIRIATSAEATAGTNDVTAMTPAKVKSVVDASLVGGVTYQGTFDASAPADLSNATKGDLYIISVAGTYAGKTWAVGDHLLINADMGGTLDSAKIDKVDNTDAVTSVAGRTGAITLSTADISGLATVASTGAYSDLSGTPTLGTAAAEDVGTGAGNVVQLDGAAKLPVVDGSQLINLPAPTLELNDLTDVTFTAGSGIDNFVLTYNNGTGLWGAEIRKSFYIQPYGATATAAQISDNRSMYYELTASGITLTIPTPSGYAIGGLVIVRNTSTGGSSITGPSMMLSDGSVVTTVSLDADDVKIFVWRSVSPAILHEISTSRLSQIDDVDLTGLANGDVLSYNSTSGNWEAVAQSGGASALNDLSDVTITSASIGEVLRYDGAAWVDAQLAYSDLSGAPTLGTAAALDVGTSANNVVQLDGTGKLPVIDGSQLINLPAGASALDDLTDVTITAASTGEVLRYDGAEWVDAQLAYSDLSGTPTLGTAAALDVGTSASNVVQLNGSAQLPAVDGSLLTGITADLSGATLDDLSDVAYPSAPTDGQILKWVAGNSRWEPVDSLVSVTTAAPGGTYTISTHDGSEEVYVLTPSVDCTVSLPTAATCGEGFKYVIKNMSTNEVTVSAAIDGGSSFLMNIQYSTLTLVSDGVSSFYVI